MKILADVNVEEALISWLLEKGHDLIRVSDEDARATDVELLSLAFNTGRVVLTRDKDFGDLVYRDRHQTVGVILIRLRARNQYDRLELFQPFWPEIESSAVGSMVVVSNDHLRIRRLLG